MFNTLSTGGVYAAPAISGDRPKLRVAADDEVSPHAFGIICTLFALGSMCMRAHEHAERRAILAALD